MPGLYVVYIVYMIYVVCGGVQRWVDFELLFNEAVRFLCRCSLANLNMVITLGFMCILQEVTYWRLLCVQDSPEPDAVANRNKEVDLEAGPSDIPEAGQDMTTFFQEVQTNPVLSFLTICSFCRSKNSTSIFFFAIHVTNNCQDSGIGCRSMTSKVQWQRFERGFKSCKYVYHPSLFSILS